LSKTKSIALVRFEVDELCCAQPTCNASSYAWPIAVIGAKGAVEIIFRADIGDADKIAARTKDTRSGSCRRSSPPSAATSTT
jgi:acetyl-CoA carboxylase carboxyltransferase component